RLYRIVPDVPAIQHHAAFCHIVESWYQSDESGLTPAAHADERDGLPAADIEINIFQHTRILAVIVKTYVAELDIAVGTAQFFCTFTVLCFIFHIIELEYPVHRSNALCQSRIGGYKLAERTVSPVKI